MQSDFLTMVRQEFQTVLEETFTVHHGVYTDKGTSLSETLSGIDAVQASKPQRGHRQTIAGQVFHTVFYIRVLIEYRKDLRTGKTISGAFWPPSPTVPTTWPPFRPGWRGSPTASSG